MLHTTLDPDAEERLKAELADGGQGKAVQQDIPLNGDVWCSDGLAGKVVRVVVNQARREVTDVVVRKHDLMGEDRVVPIEMIASSTSNAIRLSMTREELGAMPAYTYQIPPGQLEADMMMSDSMYYGGYSGMYYSPVYMNRDLMLEREYALNQPTEDVAHKIPEPPKEIAVEPGMDVEATDGHVGKVDQLLIDRETHRITHVVMREGHLWGKKVIPIPLTAIDQVLAPIIFLRLSRDEVAKLPEIPMKRWNG